MGSLVGGIVGQGQAAGDRGDARNKENEANEILQNLQQVPDISKPIVLEQYRQAGILTPEMEQTIQAQMPQAIKTNPAFQQAQLASLQHLQDRANQGLTAGDRAALAEAQQSAQGDVQARQGQIMQQMQQRGLADSGAQLAAQLANAQGGAVTENHNANALAQQSQQAALQAAAQAGQFGSQLQSQDFGQQMQQQQAANEMQRFNIQNQIGAQQRNVGAQNQAQAANLANAQQLSNANVGGANQEQQNQLQREMQQYGAQQGRAALQAGGLQNMSNYLGNQANQTAQGYANMGAGFDQAALGIGKMAFGGPSGGGSANKTDEWGNVLSYDGGQISGSPRSPIDFKAGGHVPGQAQVPGDSPKNDTVHAKLSPGEIVVPRSLAESKIGKEMLKLIHAHNSVKNRMNGND